MPDKPVCVSRLLVGWNILFQEVCIYRLRIAQHCSLLTLAHTKDVLVETRYLYTQEIISAESDDKVKSQGSRSIL